MHFPLWNHEQHKQYHIRQLCRDVKGCNIPLEMNLLGAEQGRHYPSRRFWEIASEEGCSVILGCDCHDPAALRNRQSEQDAMATITELGLNLVHEIEFLPIG